MSTHTISSSPKKNKALRFFFAFCLVLLSIYPIYKNFYNGAAITTYDRHIAFIEKRSDYFNPWQYRVLCPYIIEGLVWIYDHTIDKIYSIEEHFHFSFNQTSEPTPETKAFVELLQKKGALKYMIIFIFFRLCLNFLVFYLAIRVWKHFVWNIWLIFLGLIAVSLAMGNAVIASDLTFNTYFDNILYLLTALLVLKKGSPFWLLPITVLAAFNRETGLLIPFLYFISHINFTEFRFRTFSLHKIGWPSIKVWFLTGIALVLFALIFVSIRMYYGYVPAQVWKVPPGIEMVKLNLLSVVAAKSYFELLGLVSIIPLLIILNFKAGPPLLRQWFVFIVPAWFAVHIYSVVIYQTRLFLVPLIVIMIPYFLYIIENYYKPGQQNKIAID